MGILNVTPDSFSDGGKFIQVELAVAHAKQMAAEGADIIDVGGESSRPGSDPVSIEEELRRVIPVIERLTKEMRVPISIDTYKPAVAEAALIAGAAMVNDINGLRDKAMIEVVAKHQVPVVIMHMQGSPKTMQVDPQYEDVVTNIKNFLEKQIKAARTAGIKEILVDPGIGFGKTLEHNLEILNRLDEFKTLGCSILVGPSRKSFIGKITGASDGERLEGTIASIVVAAMKGASIVRVHDVKACKRALQISDAIRVANPSQAVAHA